MPESPWPDDEHVAITLIRDDSGSELERVPEGKWFVMIWRWK
jgi:hypothetical protein